MLSCKYKLLQLLSKAGQFLLLFTTCACPAESSFPSRPIRIVVYTGPGGLIDLTARKFAEIARRYDNRQPIVVINKPGAGGIVAFDEVLQQPADGYTVLAVTRSNISKIISAGKEHLLDSVVWAAYIMDNPHVVITNKNSGFLSWADVVRDATSRPGKQLWLGTDIAGIKHISAMHVWEKAGIQPRWIPYASGGQAVSALLGQIGHVYFGNPSDATGRPDLQIVAVCAPRRLETLPDSPTFAELGLEGLENELIWRGFAFKKGTPQHVLDWFDDIARKVSADSEWRSTWVKDGINVVYKPTEVFTKIVESERANTRVRLAQLGMPDKSTSSKKWLGWGEPTIVSLGNLLLLLLLFGGVFCFIRSHCSHLWGEAAVTMAAAAVAISFLSHSLLLPSPNNIDKVGASGVPQLWAALLLLFAVFHLLHVLGKRRTADGIEQKIQVGKSNSLQLTLYLLACVLYVMLITAIGYYPATLVFAPFVLLLLGSKKKITSVALSLFWLGFVYLVFERILAIALPGGWVAKVSGIY